jgi:hypothetical protein
MKRWAILAWAALAGMGGCAMQTSPLAQVPASNDPKTATEAYWLDQPGAASVWSQTYDSLWNACAQAAENDLFSLDRQDYRQGILTTRPMVSKQFFEFWRNDAGDAFGVTEDSLQTIRRTIVFQFNRNNGGYVVIPKVLVERLARRNRRVTSVAEYRRALEAPIPDNQRRAARGQEPATRDEYWYVVGRDLAMETQLAQAIRQGLGLE